MEEERLRSLEEASQRMEQRIVQDWRRNNRHSAIYDDRPLQPPPPGPPADIWSYGCLLAEVMTGRKLFQSGDKLASVLRPSQLLEMKLGDTEAIWAGEGSPRTSMVQVVAVGAVSLLFNKCADPRWPRGWRYRHRGKVHRHVKEATQRPVAAPQVDKGSMRQRGEGARGGSWSLE